MQLANFLFFLSITSTFVTSTLAGECVDQSLTKTSKDVGIFLVVFGILLVIFGIVLLVLECKSTKREEKVKEVQNKRQPPSPSLNYAGPAAAKTHLDSKESDLLQDNYDGGSRDEVEWHNVWL